MQFLSSPPFPIFSAGFVVARLFSSSLVLLPLRSVAAFTPISEIPFVSLPQKGSVVAIQTLCVDHNSKNQRLICSSFSSPTPSPPHLLFGVDSDVDPADTETCYDESILRLLSETTVQRIDCLVQERSNARWEGNYNLADDLKSQIMNFTDIPAGYEIVLKDVPRSSGGRSRWNLLHTKEIYDENKLSGSTILQLAHAAIGLAVENNQQKQTPKQKRYRQKSLEDLVDKAKSRLEILLVETKAMDEINSVFEVSTKNTMVQSELGGRSASDAALWFAFAGSRDQDLFHWLADIASWELGRFGKRPSFRSKYALQIVERFAAAGLKQHDKLERVVSACLAEKEEEIESPERENRTSAEKIGSNTHSDRGGENEHRTNLLNLHSDRSLLLIWKFATKQKKQRSFLRSSMKNWEEYNKAELLNENHTENSPNADDDDDDCIENRKDPKQKIITSSYNWNELFQDASRPLVVDVGCGMGVSLLGLASTNDQLPCSKESSRLLLNETLTWSDCNFVGVDLGILGVEYARGVAHRGSLEGSLHFAIDAAEDFCQHLKSYPGEIRCCMIQFPTPFRLQNKDTGNSQLPVSQLDGFMVTENLLEIIHSSLHRTEGKLLLQSNCEDVAVGMRNLACEKVGFAIVDDDARPISSAPTPQRVPQRTIDWIDMGGERAEGRGWFQRKILGRKGATETEVTCSINGTPVHRCLLKVDDGFGSSI